MSDWRLFVCDASGNPLSNLSRVASKRRFSYRLNRPAALSFQVPSDDRNVVDEAGTVILKPGRVIKGWRREGSGYSIRYAGYVWTTEDSGDADTATTSVACYDGFQRLARRLVRDAANNVPANGKVAVGPNQVEEIVRAFIDRTNAGGGVSGVRTNAAGPSLGTRTIEYEWKDVASAILELCESSGLNFYVQAEDRTDGYLGQIVLQGDVASVANGRLGWGMPPHNVSRVERLLDMQHLSNDLRALGTPITGAARPIAARTDATSITAYGRFEDVDVYGDITLQAYLDSLADLGIALRKNPLEMAKFVPQPAPPTELNALEPWIDFQLGYKVEVAAGPRLRGGFSGQQRIWGFDLDLDDDAVERVTAIYTGADA